jgi:hypothetical protein
VQSEITTGPIVSRARVAGAEVPRGRAPYVIVLPRSSSRSANPQPPRAVPDVRGMMLRDAVRSLHNAGFRVRLVRPGSGVETNGETTPAAGTLIAAGTLVRLSYGF